MPICVIQAQCTGTKSEGNTCFHLDWGAVGRRAAFIGLHLSFTYTTFRIQIFRWALDLHWMGTKCKQMCVSVHNDEVFLDSALTPPNLHQTAATTTNTLLLSQALHFQMILPRADLVALWTPCLRFSIRYDNKLWPHFQHERDMNKSITISQKLPQGPASFKNAVLDKRPCIQVLLLVCHFLRYKHIILLSYFC